MTPIVFAVLSLLAVSGVLSQTEPPISRDPCPRVVCQNGGKCISPFDLAICRCPSGYGGNRCQNKVPVKIGTCPAHLNPGEFNCAIECDNDYNCTGTQKCCNTNCRPKCTNIPPPTQTPPRLTCANVLCIAGSVCRHVVECPNCPIKPKCIPETDLVQGIDSSCRSYGYSEAILLGNRTTATGYSLLLCRAPESSDSAKECPPGSDCADGGFGLRGLCCRGKINPDTP